MKRAIAVAVILAAPPARADQVLLRGGGVVNGEIIGQTAAGLVLEVGPGRMTLPMSRVERVVTGTGDLTAYRQRAARLGGDDVPGWLALARWAAERDLLTQAREAYERVLAVDPGNGAANAALGRVRLDGRWVSREDAYRAQGLVPFEGAWVHPAERAAILDERAVEARGRERAAEAEARAREAEARARVAEAEARRAEAAATAEPGIPYPLVYGGGIYGPVYGGGSGGHRGTHGHRGPRGRDRVVVPATPRIQPTRDEAGVRQSAPARQARPKH
jgi:hypothetical protein